MFINIIVYSDEIFYIKKIISEMIIIVFFFLFFFFCCFSSEMKPLEDTVGYGFSFSFFVCKQGLIVNVNLMLS